MMIARVLVSLGAALTCCASTNVGIDLDDPERVIAAAHANDPTPERPRIGCLMPTIEQQSQVPGKLLPEIVRVIGFTSAEDGHRAKILRAGQFDVTKWQPWPEKSIRYVGCGPEAEAYMPSGVNK